MIRQIATLCNLLWALSCFGKRMRLMDGLIMFMKYVHVEIPCRLVRVAKKCYDTYMLQQQSSMHRILSSLQTGYYEHPCMPHAIAS